LKVKTVNRLIITSKENDEASSLKMHDLEWRTIKIATELKNKKIPRRQSGPSVGAHFLYRPLIRRGSLDPIKLTHVMISITSFSVYVSYEQHFTCALVFRFDVFVFYLCHVLCFRLCLSCTSGTISIINMTYIVLAGLKHYPRSLSTSAMSTPELSMVICHSCNFSYS